MRLCTKRLRPALARNRTRGAFRSGETFTCNRCKAEVKPRELMGTVPRGAGYRKVCVRCLKRYHRARSRELEESLAIDDRPKWVRWLHALLTPLVWIIYGVGTALAIIAVLSLLQVLVFGRGWSL